MITGKLSLLNCGSKDEWTGKNLAVIRVVKVCNNYMGDKNQPSFLLSRPNLQLFPEGGWNVILMFKGKV